MPRPFVGGTTFGWVVPIPSDAEVRIASDEDLFSLDRQVGYAGVEKLDDNKYFLFALRKHITTAEVFRTFEAKHAWVEGNNLSMGDLELEKSSKIMRDYFASGFSAFGALIPIESAHRTVRRTLNAACAVVFQRAAIIFDQGQETLILQSQFHSQGVMNVVTDPIRISFPSSDIWYPLKASTAGDEKYTFISLDILTRGEDIEIPKGFKVGFRGKVRFEGRGYDLTRLEARLPFAELKEDLRIKMGDRPKQR